MFIIIVLLFVFVITANGAVCNNSVILCYNYTYSGYSYSYSHVYCTIYQNNASTISQAISSCSVGSFNRLYIHIDSGLNSTTVNITLNLPNNIQTIHVIGYVFTTLQPVYLTATQTHPNVSSIDLYVLRIHNSGIFYAMFPNLTSFVLFYGYFDGDINFSSLKKLTSLSIYCYDQPERYGNITMDKEWVGGLSKLLSLGLNCGIQNITTDAFENLHSLTYIDLYGNNILELAPEVFRDLTALKRLSIYGNNYDITICKGGNNSNAFSPLKQLTRLDLRNTVIIPFNAFSTISSIQRLYLPKASSEIVPSTHFQHLHKLTYLSFFDIPLVCECSMQWASIVPNFGINIIGSCSGKDIKDSSLYTECELKESYQCFNKSISCDHSCINTQDNYRCYECEEGYGLSRTESCTDIDECSENPCEQKCSNTKGSYQCSCNTGYSISCDLFSCTDIDECSLVESNSCGSHQCMNEQGSYRCVCDEGFQLAVNNTSCHDTDECLIGNNSCSPHTCLDQVGSYTCSCGEGYQLATNGNTCEDINECILFESNSCGDHHCMNEQGSYRCVCFEGFQLSENNTSCQDTDECLNANNSCNPHTCLDQVGSYTCSCGEGYQLATNGNTCEDINECSLFESNSCGDHQCMNQPGSYRCICDEGFQLAVNNISCHDIDECLIANNSCNPHTCLNLVGSYTCSCEEGYKQTSDGMSCEDINECSLFKSNSCGDHQCMNEPGSFRCVCHEGFQLAVNNISCHDTDECLIGNNSCNPHTCLNQVGSYTCSCGEGYQLATNGKTCEDRPTNASLSIQSANSAQSTGYSNGTFIGVISFFLIIILILTLLLLTLLSIIIYMRYNKRNTTANLEDFDMLCSQPNVSIQENFVYNISNNQPKIKEYIEVETGLSSPLVEKAEPHYSEPFYSEIPQMNM